MTKLFLDNQKIETISKIQVSLLSLNENSTKEEIDEIINLIPSNMLTQKDDLMIICQLVVSYIRRVPMIKVKNGIELLQQLMPHLKELLQDESNFFWVISGGLNFLRLWFGQKELIDFEQVITSSEADKTGTIIEFFLPEIIETDKEIYEKELKYIHSVPYTKDSLFQFKKLREKYFNWIQFSGDFKDPSYLEIEKDKLRLSIKLDDIDSFQKILSNTNLSVNSYIQESVLENRLIRPQKVTLLTYAIEHNSMQIVKFLIMNEADVQPIDVNFAISNKNYELVHILESKLKDEFTKCSLLRSISNWNEEMIEYSLNNFNHDYLTKRGVPFEKVDEIFNIFCETFFSSNFQFFKSTLLPFISKNEKFVSENIHEIAEASFLDQSGYFAIEFMKHPSFDVNYHFNDINGSSLLMKAVQNKNNKIIELLLKNPKLDINQFAYNSMTIFHVACRSNLNIKAFELICNHPKIDINITNDSAIFAGYKLLASCGNFLQMSCLFDKFPDSLIFDDFQEILFQCLTRRHLIGAKLLLIYIFRMNQINRRKRRNNKNIKKVTKYGVLNDFVRKFVLRPNYNIEYRKELKQIMNELHIRIDETGIVLCPPEKEKTVIVTLRTIHNKKYQIEVNPNSTIGDLKKKIINEIKTEEDLVIKMIYKSKVLNDDDDTISSLELNKKSFIIVYSKNSQLLENLPFPHQIPNPQANVLSNDEVQKRLRNLLAQFTPEEQKKIVRLVKLTGKSLYVVLLIFQIYDRDEKMAEKILSSNNDDVNQ